MAAERIPEIRAVHADARLEPALEAPLSRTHRTWTRTDAIVELLRSRLTITGPTTAQALASSLAIDVSAADEALLALESEGVVLRGYFTPRTTDPEPRASNLEPRTSGRALEWCDRALLARIHRYTLNRLRAEIEPVTPAEFMRFLFDWQHVAAPARLTGIDGLREVIAILDGFELPAGAWERSVLPARMEGYEPSLLDMLCLSGEVGWARLSSSDIAGRVSRPGVRMIPPALVPATPIALFLREHASAWASLRSANSIDESVLTENARTVLHLLRTRGASFFNDVVTVTALDTDAVRQAIGALVALGLAASDGFSGLRALVWAAQGKHVSRDRRANFAGRWTAVEAAPDTADRQPSTDLQAWTLLRRYGIVFRRLLTREPNAAPWRELTRVYRRLEARGEIRGGRFVSGMSGEQFALPGAVERLREVRRTHSDGALVTISTADPLNLAGIVTSGERIRAAGGNRLVYRDGVPIAVKEGDYVRELTPIAAEIATDVSRALSRRRIPALLR